MTEFEEQIYNRDTALHILPIKILEYLKGEETYGVIGGYELAAMKTGMTGWEISCIWKNCQEQIYNEN